MRERKEKKNKKVLIALLLLLIAVVVLTRFAISYFSDIVTGGAATVTAGTLDITANGGVKVYQNGTSVGNTITNLNPGDLIVVKAHIVNSGTKSAWIRGGLTVTLGTMLDLNKIKVIAGDITTVDHDADILAADAATGISITSGTIAYSTADIISGSVETDGTDTAYDVAFTIYFDKTAGNSYQGKTLSFDFVAQALQYRNNPTPNWSDVVSSYFGVQ